MNPKPKVPAALLAARPYLADEPHATHPSVTPAAGSPPARYSTGVHERICELIRKGNRPHVAAGMAGIPTQTFYGWMREGRNGNVHLSQFAEDVEIACHAAEGTAIEILNNGFYSEDSKISQETVKWWLERSRADGYSKETNAKLNALISEFMSRLELALPPEIFKMVLAAATGQLVTSEKQIFRLRDDAEENQ